MPVKYILCRTVLGSNASIDIEEGEYLALQNVIDQLDHVLSVEDKFDLTIQNYLEFETTILNETTRELVQATHTAIELQRMRRLFARRLSNVLSSAHLYLGTLNHHAKGILNDAVNLERIHAAPSAKYDTSLEYRIIEALRNYAQHRALPVHGIAVQRKKEGELFVFELDPSLNPRQLKEDGKFKAEVLKQLGSTDANVPLKPVLRSYIEALGAIQKVFRDNTEAALQLALQKLHLAQKRFYDQFPSEGTVGLAALPVDDDHIQAGDPVYIAGPMESYLDYFKSQSISMQNFSRRRVKY
jgi:hypothetical protein